MANDREKLIEVLMKQVGYTLPVFTATQTIELLADCLITNGVTFAKDIDVPSKWISVEDRLPKPFRDVLVYDKLDNECFIAVLTRSGEWFVPRYDDCEFNITHWMPLPPVD